MPQGLALQIAQRPWTTDVAASHGLRSVDLCVASRDLGMEYTVAPPPPATEPVAVVYNPDSKGIVDTAQRDVTLIYETGGLELSMNLA